MWRLRWRRRALCAGRKTGIGDENRLMRLAWQRAGLQVQCKVCEVEQRDQAIKLKDAKIEKFTFEPARLKRWKFGAKAETMSAEQRHVFEQTCAEDEAAYALQAARRDDAQ